MAEPLLAEHVRGKGRMYRHPGSGEYIPSVTNVIGALDKPALPRWAAIETAKAAWRMREAVTHLDEQGAVDLLKGSPWHRRDQRADVGTAVHAGIEALIEDRRLPAFRPEETPYVEAALQFLSDHDVRPLLTEVTVLTDEYAGTFDLYAEIGRVKAILDWKTSKGVYDEVALQLAALGDAAHWHVDGALTPAGKWERLIAVHLKPDGSYQLHEVVDYASSVEGFHGLLAAWRWQQARVLAKVGS